MPPRRYRRTPWRSCSCRESPGCCTSTCSGPSRFDVFLASLPELVAAAGDVVQRADLLLSDANLHAVSSTLGSLEKASSTLPQTVHDLNALVAELRGATTELAASARSTHALIDAAGPDVQAAARGM